MGVLRVIPNVFPQKQEAHQEKEEGWKALKKTKSNPKGGKALRKEMKKNVQGKASPEVNPALQKVNGSSFGSLVNVEETNIDVRKEREKEVVLTNQSENEVIPLTHSDPGAMGSKEGGIQENTEEETESDKGEEEEGEIKMVTLDKKKERGRKLFKEVREQATQKDKLQGSQQTLEKLLCNPMNTHHQGNSLIYEK